MRRIRRYIVLVLALINGAVYATAAPFSSDGRERIHTRLNGGRSFHSATVLRDGSIFVAGGEDDNGILATAEIIDAKSGASRTAGEGLLIDARARHAAILLNDGRVLLMGGTNGGRALASAEVFDPATGRYSRVGNMAVARADAVATLLADGSVLVTGGNDGEQSLDSAEVYTASDGQFRLAAGRMIQTRSQHTATLLRDKRVLIAGGKGAADALRTTEYFDPASGAFTRGPDLNFARYAHSATLMMSGHVALIGGRRDDTILDNAEIVMPDEARVSVAPGLLNTPRFGHVAVALPDNGGVAVIGGRTMARSADPAAGGLLNARTDAKSQPVGQVEVFDPVDHSFTVLGSSDLHAEPAAAVSEKKIWSIGGRRAENRLSDSVDAVGYPTLSRSPSEWSGDGWMPGETVTVELTVHGTTVGSATAKADSEGHVSLPSSSLVGIGMIAARGGSSGLKARTLSGYEPSISYLYPSSIEEGPYVVITVNGSNLVGTDSTKVYFFSGLSEISVTPFSYSDTRLWVEVPAQVVWSRRSWSVKSEKIDRFISCQTYYEDCSYWQAYRCGFSTCYRLVPSFCPHEVCTPYYVTMQSNDVPLAVVDRTPPVITVPPTMTLEAGPQGAAAYYNVTAIDNWGGPVTISCSPASGSTLAMGSHTVNCSATDPSNNTSYASFQVNVVDTTRPIITVPQTITVEATGPQGAVVNYNVTAGDNSGGAVTISCSPPSGLTLPIGSYNVNCSATDPSNNRSYASFRVDVVDRTPPTLFLPSGGSLRVEATAPSGAVVTWNATANDTVDGPRPVYCSPPSGSTLPLGTTYGYCQAGDTRGNWASGSFSVTVVDTTAPTLHLPPSVTTEATSADGAIVTYSASADDAVSGNLEPVCSPASGSTFAVGATTVTCSATDAFRNKRSGTFTVNITDTTAPVLQLPAPLSVEATAPTGAVASFAGSATDIVDGAVAVVCSPPSGSWFPLGPSNVSCTAADTHGNSATGTFTVTITDHTPPVISNATATPSVLWPPDRKMTAVTVNVSASDLVDPAPKSSIVSVTSNEPANVGNNPNASADWQITGPLTALLRADRLGNGSGRIYTITAETTDAAGNTARTTVQVTVPHSQK